MPIFCPIMLAPKPPVDCPLVFIVIAGSPFVLDEFRVILLDCPAGVMLAEPTTTPPASKPTQNCWHNWAEEFKTAVPEFGMDVEMPVCAKGAMVWAPLPPFTEALPET